MPNCHLFSLRVERPSQVDLLDDHSEASREVIVRAVQEQPEIVTAWNHEWHVGRVEMIDEHGIYFQLGRVTRTTEDQWDEHNRAFVEIESEKARWTPVIVSVDNQIAGIIPNSIIGRKPASLGRKLRDLLYNTSFGKRGFGFFIDEVLDPDDFIEQVRIAYAVSKFSFQVTKPNFPDSYEVGEALEQWVQDLDGQQGRAEVKGHDLDRERIVRQVRQSSARGGKPSATIQMTHKSSPKTIHVEEIPVTVHAELESDEGVRNTLQRIVGKYHGVQARKDST